MSDLSEKELNDYMYDAYEKYMLKAQAMKNSKTLKKHMESGNKLSLLEKDPELRTFDEFIMQLKRGELMVQIPDDIEIEDFGVTKIKAPELDDSGELVTIMEPKDISQKRKADAYKATSEEESLEFEESDEELENTTQKKRENRSKYRVVSLKGKDGKPFDLVLDENGNDIATITYDEKGKPSVSLSPDILAQINDKLDRSEIRDYAQESTLQEEFYLQDIDSLTRAIEEGKVVPTTVKEAGERAISAKRIKEDGQYSDLDASRAIIETPEEVKQKKREEEEIKKKVQEDEERLAPRQSERDIAEEEKQAEELEEEQNTRIPQTQPILNRTEPSEQKEDDEKEEESVPENKSEQIKKFCKDKGISMKSIQAVLIVKDPQPLDDAMENSNIARHGGEVTIIQYSDTVSGKPNVAMIQGENELKVDRPREMAEKFIEKYHMRTGVIKRTEDDETYIDYSDSEGNSYREKLKRVPEDMSLDEKENFRERLEKDLEELQMVLSNDPENAELIDALQIKVYQDFVEVGLTPPEVIKEEAEETEEIEETEELQREEEDEEIDEIGRRISPYNRGH